MSYQLSKIIDNFAHPITDCNLLRGEFRPEFNTRKEARKFIKANFDKSEIVKLIKVGGII